MISWLKPLVIVRISFFFFLSFFTLISRGTVINKNLYINRGVFTTVHKTTFPWIVFNTSKTFNQLNAVIKITTNDTLIIKVINNDTVKHEFNIKGYAGFTPSAINPADSITDTLHFSKQGKESLHERRRGTPSRRRRPTEQSITRADAEASQTPFGLRPDDDAQGARGHGCCRPGTHGGDGGHDPRRRGHRREP